LFILLFIFVYLYIILPGLVNKDEYIAVRVDDVGDPSRFHSFFIAVCVDHSKPLTVLDLVCLGRLGTTVKKTALLCSVDEQGQVCCTSLQWSGIS